MSQRSAFKLLSCLALLSIIIQPIAPVAALETMRTPAVINPQPSTAEANAFDSSTDPVHALALDPIPPSKAVALGAPAPGAALDEAISEGKWPAQVAASTGAIRPDLHGPQRTDPAEGIPTHAYSPFDERRNREYPCPTGGCEFETAHVLVKLAPDVDAGAVREASAMTDDTTLNNTLSDAGVMRLEPLFPKAQAPKEGALIVTPDGERVAEPDLTRWYRAYLAPGAGLAATGEGATQTAESAVFAAVEALSADPSVAWAEPDYLRKPVGEPRLDSLTESAASAASGTSSVAAAPAAFTDPLYAQQWHLAATHVPEAWQWLSDHGLPPGGSRDIVVAVIDTGVSYTHPDLAANMWVNAVELNGISNFDDDGNGYKDDIYGADTVTPDGNPIDDHGHGTHVAGIIAAQANNGIGGVGVAYNTQIMAIKAAQYSGVLSASDIAEGIYYAVQKGADVINMSFGGYTRSQVEEDALAVAFGTSVLVAAAGNDGKPNLPCVGGRDMYPAAHNWVVGVMSSDVGGLMASFSNSDCVPYDTHEYELMAPGVDIWSTLPGGQYAAWDGTSMAAPVVSGIAALARTKWSDKAVHSSRFIMGQVAANASGGFGGVADALPTLTTAPKPDLTYLQHWVFDTTVQSATNDNDGIVDAGEMVDLGITIRNHWGKADPVSVVLDAWAEGAVQPDPYVTIVIGTVAYGAVSSFGEDDNGLIRDAQGNVTGVAHPFRFSVSNFAPNNHVIPFRLTISAGNGYDPADPNAPYTFVEYFSLVVQKGRVVPTIIHADPPVGFEVAINSVGTSNVQAAATADLNRDTHPDIISASSSNKLSISFGNGSGGFGTPVEYAWTSALYDVISGDWNQDGWADVAGVDASSRIVIWLNNGTGALAAPTTATIPGTGLQSMAAGDFNSDGHADIVAASYANKVISVLLGTGSGTFTAPSSKLLDRTPNQVAMGDIDRDGRQDLVVATSTGLLSLIGYGDGSFGTPTLQGPAWEFKRVVLSDWNGDTFPDAATVTSGAVYVWLNDGLGSLKWRSYLAVSSTTPGTALNADLNGDSAIDLAVPMQDGIYVFVNNGSGAFIFSGSYSATNPKTLIVADCDHDGLLDLVSVNGSATIGYYRNHGDLSEERGMVLSNDYYWLVTGPVLVERFATLRIEPGTQVEFWGIESDNPLNPDALSYVQVEGRLVAEGTTSQPVELFPSALRENLAVKLTSASLGLIDLHYVEIANPRLKLQELDHGVLEQRTSYVLETLSGAALGSQVTADEVNETAIYEFGTTPYDIGGSVAGSLYTTSLVDSSQIRITPSP